MIIVVDNLLYSKNMVDNLYLIISALTCKYILLTPTNEKAWHESTGLFHFSHPLEVRSSCVRMTSNLLTL